MNRPRLAIVATALVALALPLTAGCGDDDPDYGSRGEQLFAERCSGCHTLSVANARGSVIGERPTGPNLDKRKLTKREALFAIRNGGFSGAIMPQNVVVGEDAEAVAEFLARYAGSDATSQQSPSSERK